MHAGEEDHHARTDNIKAWTGLPVEESIGMTEDSGESASTVWPTFGSRTAKERNRTVGRDHGIEGRGQRLGLGRAVKRSVRPRSSRSRTDNAASARTKSSPGPAESCGARAAPLSSPRE